MRNVLLPLLTEIGLNEKESLVFEEILNRGESSISSIIKNTNIKRGDLYNIVRRLEENKLIYKKLDCKKLTYLPSDPEILSDKVKVKEKRLEKAKEYLSLTYSLYNLGTGKPGIRFAQGLEEIKELFKETLKAKTEIVGYGNVDGWLANLDKYTRWYGKERVRKGIRERIIIPATEKAVEFVNTYDKSMTNFKFVPENKFKSSLEMNIFDNKVIYITLNEPFIAILIESEDIASTQRYIFELNWASL